MRYVRALPDQRGIESPGAWLKWAIEKGHPLPPPGSAVPAHKPPSVEHPGGRTESVATDRYPHPSPPASVPDPAAGELWKDLLEDLAEEIDAPSWRVWFEGTVPVALLHNTLVLEVPNSFAQEYITERFRPSILSALESRLGQANLELVLPGQRRPSARR